MTLAGFHRLKSLSIDSFSRPVDMKRDGFIVSEGYCKIILDNYEHAMRKNGNLWATVENIKITNNAFHMTTLKQETQGELKEMVSFLQRSNMMIHELDVY